jgi:hypothetical protein
MFATLVAIVLAVASLALISYLLILLWRAAFPSVRPLFERQRIDRYVARARRGDEYLQRGALDEALSEFQAALYPGVARDRSMAQTVINHHVGLLSRFIAAADHLQGDRVRSMSLAKVDRLFQERIALQRRYLTVVQGGSRQRLREIDKQLSANTRELQSTLAKLSHEITADRGGAVRYH